MKGCMNCGNISCGNNKKRDCAGCGRWISPEDKIAELERENAELKSIAEFQQSSNMSRHFENKKLKEGLAVGSTFNKALNSMNKSLVEERDKYRNMVFDKDEQLTKAKELLKQWLQTSKASGCDNINIVTDTEQFLEEMI